MVDADRSTVSVDQTTMIADGQDFTFVTVTALDGSGNPVPGQLVVISVSGTGNTIFRPGVTNEAGQAAVRFNTIVAEHKTVSAMAGPPSIAVSINQTQAVTAVPPP